MIQLYRFGKNTVESPSNETFHLHFHDHHEIFLFLEGDARYIVEENTYPLSPRDIIVIRRNQMHRIYHNRPAHYHRIVLSVAPQFFHTYNCEEYEQVFLNTSPECRSKIDAETVRSSGLYDAFMRAKKYSRDFQDLGTPVVLSTVLEILYLLNHIPFSASPDISDTRLRGVIDYLNHHFTENITLDALARKFFLSKYYLCHLFSEGTGLTVHQYVTNKRLTFTEELIESGKPINEAAEAAGFNHYSSYYRAHKKKYGVSPKNGRENDGELSY